MSNLEVVNRIQVYELDGDESKGANPYPKITISNHHIRQDFIVIEIAGHTYTVVAEDLICAIRNAGNWR